MRCDFCQQPSVKFTPANRDGFGVGPKIALCVQCAHAIPMIVVWERLAVPSSHPHAYKPIHAIREALPTVGELRTRQQRAVTP